MRPLILLSTVLTLTAALTLPVAAIPVGGTVRTAGGGPVADAAVELRPLLSNWDRARRTLAGYATAEPVTTTTTDPAGRFVLDAPAAGVWRVVVRPSGYVARTVRIRRGDENARDAGAARAPTIALRAAAPVAGQVVDGGGAPLSAVLIEAKLAHAKDETERRAVSGDGGRLTLADLDPAASYQLTAATGGYAPATVTITPRRQQVKIVLHPTRPGHGRVIDGDERPLAGVEVTVTAPASAVRARAGEDGRFALAAVSGVKVDLRARKKGFSPLTVRGVELPPGKEPVDLGTLVLVPGAAVTGGVVDLEKEPIAGAEVRTTPADGRPRRWQADRIRRDKPAAVTGPDGGFAVEDLEPGAKLHLLVSAEGYLPAWAAGVEAPNAEPLVVVLEPASVLSGRVIDEASAAAGRSPAGWSGKTVCRSPESGSSSSSTVAARCAATRR